jgi:serine/threonine protein kinase
VYLFSEDESDSSPSDCFFDVSDVSSAPIASTDDVFPETLGPFGLSSTEIRPELDFQACSFCIDSTQALVDGVFFDNPQLQKLEELGLFPLTGRISPKHSVTLTEGARRQAMIPSSATSFVYAYQCVKTFTDAQKAALDEAEMAESDDVSFVSLGGFVYLDCNDLAVGVRAIQIHSVASRFGTIDLEEDDNRVTTPVASPELLEGLGIGLETDIYSFGCVMWEVFTRREAWHWMDSNALAIRQRVLVDKKRPRMMPGLSDECACMVRQCLFDRPSSRPTAKQVTEWLDTQRRELQKELAAKKNEIVRGRDYDADGKLVRRLSRSFTGSRHIDSYMIVDHKDPRANECWSSRGRFSLYKSHGNPEGDKVTSKRIFGIAIDQTNGAEGTRDEWEEDAEDAFDEGSPRTTAYPPLESPQPVMMRAVLESEPEPEPEPEPVDGSPFVEPEPEPRPQLGQQSTDGATPWQVAGLQAVKMLQQHEWVYTDPHRVVVSFGQPGKMGIVFGSCWPFVRRLMPDFKSNSQAERTKEQPIGSLNKENFEPGCRLLAIRFQGNTYPIDRPDAPRMTYEEAVEILKGTSSRSRQQPLELVFEPRHRFGLVFTRKDGHGGWEHTFPEVASVEPVDKATDLPTIFSQHPEIRSGSRLKSINGISTDGLAEGGVFTCEALRLFRMGSVKLEFELSTHVHTSIVEPWMRAGLDAVSMVRRHEDYRKSEGSSGGDEMDLRNKIQDRDAEIAELKAQLRRLMPEGVPPAS